MPVENLVHILKWLPFKEIASCCRVSTHFNLAASDPALWKPLVATHCGRNFLNIFSLLVENGFMTWKEVLSYRLLRSLLLFTTAFTDDFRFSIVDGSNVAMRKGEELTVLEGEPGSVVTSYAYDRKCLYTFRSDGLVVQWDTSTKQSKQIETSLSQNNPVTMGYQHKLNPILGFAHNGFIVIKYGSSPLLEIIEVETKRNVIIHDLIIGWAQRMLCHNTKFYLLTRRMLHIWDLQTLSKEKEIAFEGDSIRHEIVDFFIKGEQLYAYSTKGAFFIYNLSTHEKIKWCVCDHKGMQGVGILMPGRFSLLGNLLMVLDNSSSAIIFDLNKNKIVKHTKKIWDQSKTIDPLALQEIVVSCRENLSFCEEKKKDPVVIQEQTVSRVRAIRSPSLSQDTLSPSVDKSSNKESSCILL